MATITNAAQQSRIINDAKSQLANQVKSGKVSDVAAGIEAAKKDYLEKGGTEASFKQALGNDLNARFESASDSGTLTDEQKETLTAAVKELGFSDVHAAASGTPGTSGAAGTSGLGGASGSAGAGGLGGASSAPSASGLGGASGAVGASGSGRASGAAGAPGASGGW